MIAKLKGHCHGHLGESAQILQRTWYEHEFLLKLREENIKVFLLELKNEL